MRKIRLGGGYDLHIAHPNYETQSGVLRIGTSDNGGRSNFSEVIYAPVSNGKAREIAVLNTNGSSLEDFACFKTINAIFADVMADNAEGE